MRGRIEEVLPRVARPARYTGGEINSVGKPPNEVSVRIALAFPDIYEVGMSNLGLRILYSILNAEPHVWAERVFAPAPDMEGEMRRAGIPLFSLESSLPVGQFDLVGFSLAYEMTYTTVLNMLALAGVPPFACDRTDGDPIVIAGGHCASNPEPMSTFIDAFAIGDGEEVIIDIVRAYEASRGSRQRVLNALAQIDGVYVPSVHGQDKDKPTVRARVVLDLEHAPYPDKMVVPWTEAVHDRAPIEIMRGCSRGCRFCQAGMITRPVRERSLARLCEQAQTLLENTGYEEIALTSLSSADYSAIDDLVRTLIDRHERERVGVSLPSLRADAQCVRLAAQIQRVRKSGLTFAPEAGTQRLRDVINKNVKEEDLLDAVEAAVECGWRRIKLYFMIGLPTETDEDLLGIADLVSKVIGIGRRHKVPLSLNVTISPFVPKPHTPFQWRPMDTLEELDGKISLIRPLLKGRNIALSWHDPRCSRVEAALARGDARLAPVIHQAWRHGANLEQDSFEYDRWLAAFESAELDIADYANADIPKNAAVPWDHIDVGVSKRFLAAENAHAERAEATADCRFGVCSACGVREALAAVYGRTVPCPPPLQPTRTESALGNRGSVSRAISQPSTLNPQPALFTFRKGEQAKWLGHLDVLRVFERAIRMSGIEVAYTQGFNPRIKMSIASALPLGATADRELLTIHLAGRADLGDVVKKLNNRLPDGLDLLEARILPEHTKGPAILGSGFIVGVSMPDTASTADLRSAVNDLLASSEILTERESGKKRKTIDLRPGIESLEVLGEPGEAGVRIAMNLRRLEFSVKPAEVVRALAERVPGIEMTFIHRKSLKSSFLEST